LFAGSGIRVKIIEQMAMGRIIVSTSKGAEGIDVQNGINGFLANTADEFYEIISRILNNEYDLQTISQNARKYIESTFDSKKIFNEFLLFLNSKNIKKNY
jgi:glycosyltransferase involved in cell wall biosynthesis